MYGTDSPPTPSKKIALLTPCRRRACTPLGGSQNGLAVPKSIHQSPSVVLTSMGSGVCSTILVDDPFADLHHHVPHLMSGLILLQFAFVISHFPRYHVWNLESHQHLQTTVSSWTVGSWFGRVRQVRNPLFIVWFHLQEATRCRRDVRKGVRATMTNQIKQQGHVTVKGRRVEMDHNGVSTRKASTYSPRAVRYPKWPKKSLTRRRSCCPGTTDFVLV